ncbi:MAG: HPP family protein [Candidatus Neomarinimicrobiota bacterium]
MKRNNLRSKLSKRTLNQMIIEFKIYWKNYVYQSLAATIATMIILLALSLEHAVVVASIAASVFIIFAMPNSVSARKRAIIGGHWIGLFFGSMWTIIPQPYYFISIIVFSLAVGTTILVMVIFDMEHPPAAGTALGVAITGFSWNVGIAIITSTILLAIISSVFKPYLKDLV